MKDCSQQFHSMLLLGVGLYATALFAGIFSGHVLFLTYALLTSRSPVARLTAALIGIQVLYLKIVVWHKWEWIGGLLLGSLAALWLFRLKEKILSPVQPVEVKPR